jgi:hypothetical protein
MVERSLTNIGARKTSDLQVAQTIDEGLLEMEATVKQ